MQKERQPTHDSRASSACLKAGSEGARALSPDLPASDSEGNQHISFVNTQEDFLRFIEQAGQSTFLGLDTEFLREKTYYPKLCLLQAAVPGAVYIIDPFSIDDLGPLKVLLEDKRIVKIVHAGAQDIEIFYHELGCIPMPVFDTQIAGSLLGLAQQSGLGAAVGSFLGVQLKKSESFTDWSRRPLTQAQIEYAADDVAYLCSLMEKMRERLSSLGRTSWLDNEIASLVSEDRYKIDPRQRYLRLKRVNQLEGKSLAAAQEICAWRETAAQENDIPRKWIISDEEIFEICRKMPKDLNGLFTVRGLQGHLSTSNGRKILKCIARARAVPPDNLPKIQPASKEPEKNVEAALDLGLALLHSRARENDIAPAVLATHADIEELARGHRKASPLMRGWRRKIIGDDLLDLFAGKMSMGLCKNGLEILRKSTSDDDACGNAR